MLASLWSILGICWAVSDCTRTWRFGCGKGSTRVHQANSGTVEAGLSRLQDSFRQVYDLSTKLAFATSEDLELFFRLSGFPR